MRRGKTAEEAVLDASILAPLILVAGRRLIQLLRSFKFNILELTIYETCNAFWKGCSRLGKLSADEAVEACSLTKPLLKLMNVWRVSCPRLKAVGFRRLE